MTCILWISAMSRSAWQRLPSRWFMDEPMGPLPVMAIHKDDGIEISFIHTGGGLVCTGDVPFDILEPGGSIYRVKARRYDCYGGNGTGRASGAVRELSPVQCQFVGQ